MLKAEKIIKKYNAGGSDIKALDELDFEAPQGEFITIVGPSGSGKTTFLMILGGMTKPTSGKVLFEGTDLYSLSNAERASFRAANIGFVFQTFHLVPYLNSFENVILPTLSKPQYNPGKERVLELLRELGLEDRKSFPINRLSVGEKQRVALARALFLSPKLILADEPTGNLDSENAKLVLDCLNKFRKDGGTVILVTHNQDLSRFATRTIKIKGGRIFK